MKKKTFIIAVILFGISSVFAQTPNQFKYQAILRDANGVVMSNENAIIDISILTSDLSTVVFTEQHSVTTTAQGLINLNIGSIEDLSVVDFAADNYFIEISVNGTIMGTSQLLSVPYALNSKTVDSVNYSSVSDAPTTISDFDLDANNQNIINVATPVNDLDAVNKAYIDALEARITALELLHGIATVTDIDGNEYPIIQIGEQIWMAENLRVTHFPDGTLIPNVPDNTDWSSLGTNYGLCYYDNDSAAYSQTYGAFYTWETAMYGEDANDINPSGVQGVCPDGWHLPSLSEWSELNTFVTNDGYSGNVGAALKSTTGWNDGLGIDAYGFNSLATGIRYDNGNYSNEGVWAFFWGTTESNSTSSYNYRIYSSTFGWVPSDNNHGFSVRCLKD